MKTEKSWGDYSSRSGLEFGVKGFAIWDFELNVVSKASGRLYIGQSVFPRPEGPRTP